MSDKRRIWEFGGYGIYPVNCYRSSSWGKCAEPIMFGKVCRIKYWVIHYNDGTFAYAGTKEEVRKLISAKLLFVQNASIA